MSNMLRTKIGILTFHYAVNPGSVLQAYGLYQTIRSLSLNFDVHIINYQGTKYRQRYVSFIPSKSVYDIVMRVYNMITFRRYQKFWDCIGGLGKRLDEKNVDNLSGYDVIISGSDQVWNLELTRHNFRCFIPFCKCKKISYAASIGTKDFPEEDKETVAKYLKDFSFLSVREPEAQLAIERLIGIKPELVIDPSLLLQRSEYEKLAQKPKMKKDYVFLYLRHKDSEIAPFARNYAKKHGLQLVECHGGARKIYSDDKIVIWHDPKQWLGWLMNAKYVFTDSFHGCAFCINCNKQFFVKISSANSQMSSRIFNIIERYGLKDRMIVKEDEMFAVPDIDFTESNALLEKDREYALDYLKRSLDIKES